MELNKENSMKTIIVSPFISNYYGAISASFHPKSTTNQITGQCDN